MNTRAKTKSNQPAMIALAAGNFLFAMGLVMAMQAYLQLQDTAYGGIFSGTDWWKALRIKFPNTGQTEISMGLACLAFACSSIVHEINLIFRIFSTTSKDQ